MARQVKRIGCSSAVPAAVVGLTIQEVFLLFINWFVGKADMWLIGNFVWWKATTMGVVNFWI